MRQSLRDVLQRDTLILELLDIHKARQVIGIVGGRQTAPTGGPHTIYRNPRMAYAFNAVRNVEEDGHAIEIRYGEISTPAIATVEGWVFEIHDDEIELLMKPLKRKSES